MNIVAGASSSFNWIPTAIAIASLFVSLFSIYLAHRYRDEFQRSDQYANIAELLRNEYTDREISLRDEGSGEVKIVSIAEARQKIDESYSGIWENDDTRRKFILESLKSGETWENRVVYELARSVEQVGIMVMSGAIPVDLVLSQNASVIVGDWNLSRAHVSYIRKASELKIKRHSVSDFSGMKRIHAEWLAYLSTIYCIDRFGLTKEVSILLDSFEEKNSSGRIGRILLSREGKIRDFEKELMPKSVQKRVKQIVRRADLSFP